MELEIKKLLEIIKQKKVTVINGKERIAKTLENKQIDRLPLIFWNPQNTSVPGNKYNMKEQFFNKERMLYSHLEEMANYVHNSYDAQLCIRPNFGTIFIPAMFDLDYEIREDTYPWLTSHLSKKEIQKIQLDSLLNNDMMQRAIEFIQYFQEILPNWIHIYQPDTQGPFDIAHAIYGDDLFYDIYDDPDFVHCLMEVSTEMYIRVSKRLKKVIGEKKKSCYHGHALPLGIYMRNGGVRISEDSATIISPEHIDEFVIPYDKKALKEFGGGFIHFCGKNEYLLEAYLKLDLVRAINFGNPDMYNFELTMKKFIESKKCYFGLWPKEEKENLQEYLLRIKKATKEGKKGMILHFDTKMFPEYSGQQIFEKWIEMMGGVIKE